MIFLSFKQNNAMKGFSLFSMMTFLFFQSVFFRSTACLNNQSLAHVRVLDQDFGMSSTGLNGANFHYGSIFEESCPEKFFIRLLLT